MVSDQNLVGDKSFLFFSTVFLFFGRVVKCNSFFVTHLLTISNNLFEMNHNKFDLGVSNNDNDSMVLVPTLSPTCLARGHAK